MPLPILLGILGAGLAAQAGVQGYGKPWAEGRQEKARGKRFTDIMGNFDPDQGQDAAQRMMAGGGLISPDTYSNNGFADANSQRDFAEQLKAQSHASGLASGRAGAAASRARDAATLAHERQMERTEHLANLQSDENFAQYNREVVQQNLDDATARGTAARERREARQFEISEQTAAIQTETEVALAASYPSYSNLGYGGSGSYDAVTERIRQRQASRQATIDATLEAARTRVDRITGPTTGLTRRPATAGGNSGGGIPNSAVTVD